MCCKIAVFSIKLSFEDDKHEFQADNINNGLVINIKKTFPVFITTSLNKLGGCEHIIPI